MKKSFLEWLREVLPNDHAVKQQYHLSWLIAEYPDLYEDFEAGNDTTFAKLYFDKGLGEIDCYKEIRAIYDTQQQTIESLKALQAQLEAELMKHKSDDYVLFPKMPHPHVFECGFTRFMDLDPDYELEVDDLIGAWLKMIEAQKEVVMSEAQENDNAKP